VESQRHLQTTMEGQEWIGKRAWGSRAVLGLWGCLTRVRAFLFVWVFLLSYGVNENKIRGAGSS